MRALHVSEDRIKCRKDFLCPVKRKNISALASGYELLLECFWGVFFSLLFFLVFYEWVLCTHICVSVSGLPGRDACLFLSEGCIVR